MERDQYYWITDPIEEYIPVKRYGTGGQDDNITFEVFNTGRLVRGSSKSIVGVIPPPGNITLCTINEDLVENDDISEASIMWSLKTRFFQDKIYSCIGSIIIALNPYKLIPGLYSKEVSDQYRETGLSDVIATPPHIWRIAHGAYVQLTTRRTRQAIVISGESGAGKTETTKKCLQYLSAIGGNPTNRRNSKIVDGITIVPIEERVIGTNPLLESFGNSKTARNDNSSRFGKWLEINFTLDTNIDPRDKRAGYLRLTGASITQYLLEKSRVVFQSEGERNYHIFYQICSDPAMELVSPSRYHFLNQSGCMTVEGLDDAKEWADTNSAMENLQFPETDRTAIFNALKSILFLGNIEFGIAPDGFSAIISEGSDEWIDASARMLKIDSGRIRHCLLNRSLVARGETMVIPLNPVQSIDTRNALAKEMYGRLFNHIVSHANISLRPAKEDLGRGQIQLCCGLLDIFGFELLQCNSFEQLCINYANEKLQQYFLQFVLKKEQELYEQEGIVVPRVVPRDNEDVLHLIEAKIIGIFARLDEEVKISKGSDAGFISKVEQDHNKKTAESRFFRDVKMTKSQFEIRHFAGVVRYESVGFLEKNKDKLYEHLEELLMESNDSSFRMIMLENGPNRDFSNSSKSPGRSSEPVTPTASSKASTTLSMRFQVQLSQLIEILNNSDAHFVRCIKPNSRKNPNEIESGLVLRQLQYSGVLEAIMIRKNGFPTRRSLADFRRAYWMLSGFTRHELATEDDFVKCQKIAEGLVARNPFYQDQIHVGRTIVFFRPEVLQALEQDRLARGIKGVIFIQSKFRKFRARLRVVELKTARAELRELITQGLRMNSSNTDILPTLQERTKQFQIQLRLCCCEMKQAGQLIKRLDDVNNCKNQAQRLLSSTSSEHFKDVLAEFQAVKVCLAKIDELGLEFDKKHELQARLEVLRERGEALLNLRSAIENNDDDSLRISLAEITRLNTKFGIFCADDEDRAKSALQSLTSEIQIMTAVLPVISSLHSQYQVKIQCGGGENFDDELFEWIVATVPVLNHKLMELLHPFAFKSPASPLSARMFDICKAIQKLREHWASSNWSAVAVAVESMLQSAKDIIEFTLPTSKTLLSLGKRLVDILRVEVGLVREELDRRVVMPTISESLEIGRVVEDLDGNIDTNSCDCEAIASTIAHVNTLEWVGEKVRKLVKRIQVLIRARQAVIDGRWDDALACTESLAETRARRLRLSKLSTELSIIYHKQEDFDETWDGIQKLKSLSSENNSEAAPTDSSDDFDVANAGDYVGVMLLESSKIESELKMISRLALENYIQTMLLVSVQLGKVNSDGIDITGHLSNISTSSLRLTDQEIAFLLQNHAMGNSVKISMLGVAGLVQTTRNLVLQESWPEVVELMGNSLAVDIFALEPQNSFDMPPLRSQFFTSVKDELRRVLLFAKNQVAMKGMLDALKVGSISGSVGNLDFTSANTIALKAAIAEAESCESGDPGGLLSNVQSLLIFCHSFLDMRQRFIAKKDAKQTQEIINDVRDLLLGCGEIDENVTSEISLLHRHVMYCRARDSIREGLTLKPPVQYVVPTGNPVGHLAQPSQRSARSGSGITFVAPEPDNKVILEEEDLRLNTEVLSTDQLREGLLLASQLKELMDITSFPEEYYFLVRVGECIKSMREAVSVYDWEEASKILEIIKVEELQEKVPLITEEIIGSEQPINNFLVIAECKAALAHGYGSGPIGFIDTATISTEKLDKAINICQKTVSKTSRTEALFKAVLVVADVRKAQIANDWGSLKTALRRAETDNIGTGATAICAAELQRAALERDNYDLVAAMKRGILQEEIKSVEGIIDASTVTTEKLSVAVNQANATILTRKGDITNACGQLSETVVKFRRAVMMQQSFTVQSFVDPLKQDIDVLKSAIESVESSTRPRISKSMRSPMIQSPRASRKSSFLVSQPESASMPVSAPVGGAVTTGKSAILWEFYTELIDVIERELTTVQHHLAVCELETDVTKALQENGITTEMIGHSDWSKVKLDDLKQVIKRKDEFDSALKPIPPSLHSLFKAAHLILDMRSAIVANNWEALPALLEEAVTGLTGQQKEICRAEVLAIQHEQENRLIMSIMTDALKQGRIEGSLGNVRLGGVSFEQLANAIGSSKSLTPRTEDAAALILTAETILPMRQQLCEDPINWKLIKDTVYSILSPTVASTLHPSILPELRLVQATADDYILCNAMEAALRAGGPTGEPGFLNLSNIDVSHLSAACQTVIETSVKTDRAAQLWNACRYTKSLREALQRSASGDEQVVSEATKSIRSMISDIFEARKSNPNDAAWVLCRDEVMLITKDSHIAEIRENIQETIRKASKIYDNRSKMGLSQNGRKPSVTSAMLDVQLPIEDLNKAIEQAEHMEFESDILYRYVKCAKIVRNMRTCLIGEDWENLNSMVSDEKTAAMLEVIPSALTELAMVKQESHNYQVVNIIEKALQPRSKDDTDRDHSYLKNAIDVAQAAVVTSVTAKQLLECAQNVLQLRVGISQQNSKEVGAALRWFRANPHRCPPSIQQEAQRAYIMHQNDLLQTGLTKALSEGAATGVRGNLDVSSIDVTTLHKLLESAREVKHQTAAVHELIEAGEVIYALRCSLKKNDANGVHEALEQLSTRKMIPDIILEEIALARAELENSTTITALYEALSTFDDANPRSLELSLVGTQQLVNNHANSAEDGANAPSMPSASPPTRPMSSRRRYSYENINSSDIDPETIDVAELDHALEIAKTHGVQTDQARRLFRTTLLVRSLRAAMKQGDWPKVEEIISESNFSKGVGDVFDIVASREIQVILSQLEMRKSIVDLSKALKVGWAHCSNGIVDTSTLSTIELNGAIERAEKSMYELGHSPQSLADSVDVSQFLNLSASLSKERERDRSLQTMSVPLSMSMSLSGSRRPSLRDGQHQPKSVTQSQVELLLSSAKIVAEVRNCLMKRELERAGILADEGIRSKVLHSSVQRELKLYAIEINRALGMMKLCQSLREGMAKGDLETLEPLIIEARQASMQVSNDLGLVRTLEKAQLVYKSFLACRKALVKLSSNYNIKEIQKTIDNAISIKISGYLIDNAVKRLHRLIEFETAVNKLRRSNGGGALINEESYKKVLELAGHYGMKHHPWTHRAEISLKLAASSQRTALILEAAARQIPFVAATETLRLKRAFLNQSASQKLFVMENFPRLRSPKDFYFRVTSSTSTTRPSVGDMLTHTDEEIFTSLTVLSPALAALAVLIFTQCVQGIERQMYTQIEVLIRNMIFVGRNCVAMRDEILLQVIKQIRNNKNEASRQRLWSVLGACLSYFPPSNTFENYVELFLWQESEEVISIPPEPTVLKSPAAMCCLRYLHQSVFKFGYNRPIVSKCDLSLRALAAWLSHDLQFDSPHHIQAVTAAMRRESLSQTGGLIENIGSLSTAVDDSFGSETVSLLYDPAFPIADSRGVRLPQASTQPGISQQHMRGTRANWIERFNQFLGNERFTGTNQRDSISGSSTGKPATGTGGVALNNRVEEVGTKSKMSITVFVETLSYSSTTVDKTDKDLLQHLVFGRIPEHKPKIAREYFCDVSSFYFVNESESAASIQRREWLRKELAEIMVPLSSGPPLKPSERRALATEFWYSYIVPFCAEFPLPTTTESTTRKSITISKAEVETLLTWEMYREILLVAMEMFLESEHNRLLQERLASSDLPLNMRLPPQAKHPVRGISISGNDPSSNGNGSLPFDGFTMFTVNPDTGNVEPMAQDLTANSEGNVEDGNLEY